MSLTVRELITQLEQFGDDMEVRFTYNYGDYWKTTVAADVRNVDTGHVKHSDYHQMDAVVDMNEEQQMLDEAREEDPDQDYKMNPAIKEVVLLS